MANELDLVAAMTNAKLSDFDGKAVVRAAVALFGTDGLSEAMAVNPMEIPQGSTGTCVIRWVCEEVKHKKISKDTPDLLTRNHRLKVTTIAFADHKAIAKILDEQEETIRKAIEKAKGVEPIKAADGKDPIGDAEKVDKARKRGEGNPPAGKGDKGVVQSGEFKGEPYDPAKEAARVRKPRTPAAPKAPVGEAKAASDAIAAGKTAGPDASVTDIADARKAAGDGG